MDFLGEHCGQEDAQAKLDETCAMLKPHHYWFWIWVVLILAVAALPWLLAPYLEPSFEEWLGGNTVPIWIGFCLLRIITELAGARRNRMRNLWRQRGHADCSPALALKDMHATPTMSVWQASEKEHVGLAVFFLALSFLLLYLQLS